MPLESALSYLKGTSFKLGNKDVVLGLYWEMFYMNSWPHSIQQHKKFILTDFDEIRLEQTT